MTEIKTYDELVSHLDCEDQVWLTWKDTPEAVLEILKVPELISAPSKRIKYAMLKSYNTTSGKHTFQMLNLQNGRLKSDHVRKMLEKCTIDKIDRDRVFFEMVEEV